MNKIIQLGFIEKGTGKHQSNAIYDTGGVLPTQYAGQYKSPPMIVIDCVTEQAIVSMLTMQKEQH